MNGTTVKVHYVADVAAWGNRITASDTGESPTRFVHPVGKRLVEDEIANCRYDRMLAGPVDKFVWISPAELITLSGYMTETEILYRHLPKLNQLRMPDEISSQIWYIERWFARPQLFWLIRNSKVDAMIVGFVGNKAIQLARWASADVKVPDFYEMRVIVEERRQRVSQNVIILLACAILLPGIVFGGWYEDLLGAGAHVSSAAALILLFWLALVGQTIGSGVALGWRALCRLVFNAEHPRITWAV